MVFPERSKTITNEFRFFVCSPREASENTDTRSSTATVAPTTPVPFSSWIGTEYWSVADGLGTCSKQTLPCCVQTRSSGWGRAGVLNPRQYAQSPLSSLVQRGVLALLYRVSW